jgi:hypothetical protein
MEGHAARSDQKALEETEKILARLQGGVINGV